MTEQQKKEMGAWEIHKRYKMPQGGNMSLAYIIEEEYKRAKNNPTDMALPEFKTNVHACLHYIFLIDWSKICPKRIPSKFRGDGIAFGRSVSNDWLDVCRDKRYFKDGMLSNYDTIVQVKEVIEKMTQGSMTYFDKNNTPSWDYIEMEERMFEIRQHVIDAQEVEKLKAEEQRQQEEAIKREQEMAEKKRLSEEVARRAAEEQERRKREEESKQLDKMMIETQQLIDQAPIRKATLKLYVRPMDEAEPYTAEIAWNNIGKSAANRVEPEVFTGPSFSVVISKAKTYVSNIIDDIIKQHEKDKKREELQKKMEEQNNDFTMQMEEMRKMMEEMNQKMQSQQRAHEASISQLQQQINEL